MWRRIHSCGPAGTRAWRPGHPARRRSPAPERGPAVPDRCGWQQGRDESLDIAASHRQESRPAVKTRLTRARNTDGVETATPGLTSTSPAAGNDGAGARTSPIPDISAGRPTRQTGTSAPRSPANWPRSSADSSIRQNRHSSRNAAAASADPPPMPDATGRFFSSTSLADAGQPARAASAGRLAAPDCRPRRPARRRKARSPTATARRPSDTRQPVANPGEHHQAVEQMIAVVPPPDDMQVQVDLRRREFRKAPIPWGRDATGR